LKPSEGNIQREDLSTMDVKTLEIKTEKKLTLSTSEFAVPPPVSPTPETISLTR
jgi:hypothetical protein